MQITEEEINAAMTPKGGFTRAQLASWGVPWPPPKGWKESLIKRQPIGGDARDTVSMSPIRPNVPAHDLLCKVVLAVIDKGHASDLYEFPDVLEYFGAQMPDDPDTAYGAATREFFAPKDGGSN